MTLTNENDYLPKLRNTYLRLTAIAIWFAVMLFAAYGGLLIHAFVGFASLTVLIYLTIKQANARINYLKKKRIKQLSNYQVGADYMKIFDPKRGDDAKID